MASGPLLWTAFAGYAAGTAAYLGYLFARRVALARLGFAAVAASLVVNIASYGMACKATQAMVVASRQGSLSLLALLIVLVFVLLSLRHSLNILGAFVMPLVTVATGFAAAAPAVIRQPETFSGPVFVIHVMATFMALAGFISACGVAIAYLVEEIQIRSRKPGMIAFALPSLDVLDRLAARIAAVSVLLLTVGAATGVMFEHGDSGRYWPRDPKSAASAVYWIFYVAALALRRFAGWRGRRQALMLMAGFVLVVFVFAAVSHLPPGAGR